MYALTKRLPKQLNRAILILLIGLQPLILAQTDSQQSWEDWQKYQQERQRQFEELQRQPQESNLQVEEKPSWEESPTQPPPRRERPSWEQ